MTSADLAWIERFWRVGDPVPAGSAPVAFGGSLTPAALLAGYRHGLLPMPTDTDSDVNEVLYADQVRAGGIRLVGGPRAGYELAWWSPDPRPVLTAATVHLGRGLTKTLRSRRAWTTTTNQAFDRVVLGCRADREPRWLTDDLVAVMTQLHEEGWYHSVEVWAGSDLVGGALGLGLGAVFSCDSMFHTQGGASMIAIADLALRVAGDPGAAAAAVLDLQWDHPHVRRLGARFVARCDFLSLAAQSSDRMALPAEPRSVGELLARLRGRSDGALG